MIYLELLNGFLKVGCMAFGGAYGAIPLIRDVVLSYGWLSDESLTAMIAISESTPGPIMVNLATYIGSNQAGILGSIIATIAVVLPSFILILLLSALLKTFIKNKYVQAILRGLKPCVIGIVLATGIYMIIKNCFGTLNNIHIDIKACLITVILALIPILIKKKISPIQLILCSAILGILFYGM